MKTRNLWLLVVASLTWTQLTGLLMASATEVTVCPSSQQCAKTAEINRLLKELSDMQQCNGTSSCAAGWSKFDNNCYKLFPIAGTTFEVADQVCTGYNNGHLASIHSVLEEKFILGLDASAKGIYLGAQKVTTVATQSCPSGQLWYPRTGACISLCSPLTILNNYNATANWQTITQSFGAGFTTGCIKPITAPAGTVIQFNLTKISQSACDAGCTGTALQLSDNYGPLSNPLCCSTDAPRSITFTSNNVLTVIQTTTSAFEYSFSYRYIGTPTGQTTTATTTKSPATAPTVAPQSCPSGQLWYPRTGACIEQCGSLSRNATANWQGENVNWGGYAPDKGCYWPFTAPKGTMIQFNVTSIGASVCDAGCTVTSLQFSDNFQTPGNPLCCSTNAPTSFTFNSNNVLMIVLARWANNFFRWDFAYRYIGTSTGQTTTATTTKPPTTAGSVNSFKWIDGTPFDYTHFAPGQPDGDGQYLHLWPSQGGWNDYVWEGTSGLGQPLYFACKNKAMDMKASINSLLQTISILNQQCDPCSSQPCKNGGSCTSTTTDNSYRCNCPDYIRGDNCEVILTCTPTSCSANADCFVQNHQINCVCKSGYTTDEQGVCSIKTRQACMWGDPHYTTFDGLRYDYQGTCPYVVTQPCDYDISPYFSVRAQNKQVDNFRVSVVTWVELNIFGYSFKVSENLALTVDGVPVSVPYQHFIPYDPNWKVKAYITAGQMHIVTPEHMEIIFYPGTLCVTVPEPMVSGTGRLCGLFGDVDNKCQNDMRGMKKNLFGVPQDTCVWPVDGPNAMTAERFGDDWIDDFLGGKCIPGTIMTNTSLPCTPAEYVAAKQACQAIEDAKSGRGIFARCAAMGAAKLGQLLDSCAYDICADKNFRCSALTTFVHTCQQSIPGTKLVDWRTNVQCPLVCPANQYYSDCVSGCQTTCANMTSKAVCNKPCIEGCTCSSGTVLDGTGKNCIPEKSCGCTDSDGNYHEAGTIWMNSDCTKANKCLEFDKLITKDVACGTRGTCSSANKQYQCTCATGSTGTCKTAAETIVNSIEYLLCNCK